MSLLALVVGVYALTPGVAPNPGHTIGEVAPPASCTAGQALKWDGAAWICAASAVSGNTPTGGIIMYSGAWAFDASGLGTGALAGWALCNGNNGAPNLVDKFVMGAGTSGTLGGTGGANSITLTTAQMPAHTHEKGTLSTDIGGVHSHTTTTSSDGSHSHTFSAYQSASTSTYEWHSGSRLVESVTKSSESTGTTNAHTHTVTTNTVGTAHTHPIWGTTASAGGSGGSATAFDNRPAYVQLAYIMKL